MITAISSILIEHKLLSDNDVTFFNRVLKDSSPLMVLKALLDTYLYNIAGEHYRDVHIHFKEENDPETLEKLNNFYNNLKNAGLLSNKAVKYFGTDLQQYKQDIIFLNVLIQYENIQNKLSAPKLLPYVDKWYENSLLSEDSYKRLIADIKNDGVESYFQLIGYLENAKDFTLSAYSTEPEIYLEQIHKEVAGLLPELAFTNFSFIEQVNKQSSFGKDIFYDYVVSIKCNNKKYKQKSFSRLNNRKAECYIDHQEFYQIFNKILVENQSPWRLHHIAVNNDITDSPRFGIIALKNEQTDLMHNSYGYFRLSYENFTNKMTHKAMQSAIEEWKQLGLLAHLSEMQIDESINSIKERKPNDYNEMLLMFPNVIYAFDTELGNLYDPYKELLMEFSAISHGAFEPENIVDTFENPINTKINVAFEINGNKYSTALNYDNDWIDTNIIDLINEAVIDNNLSGRFYNLPGDGQVAHFIYLEHGVKDVLVEKRLLNF